MSEENTIYDLKLHEEIEIDNHEWVKRVAGGWIYRCDIENGVGGWSTALTFVPKNNEFI